MTPSGAHAHNSDASGGHCLTFGMAFHGDLERFSPSRAREGAGPMAIVPGAGNCSKAPFAPAIAPIGFEKWGLSKAIVPRAGRRELTILAASTRRGGVYSMSALPPKADIRQPWRCGEVPPRSAIP
jgi:hypothetical protein